MGFISRVEALQSKWRGIDLLKETVAVAEDHEKEIADRNRQQLYEKGEKADGTKLKPYKNPAYAREKNRMHPEIGFGAADFYVTGDFSKSIFADVRDRSIILDGAAYHTKFLVERDGEGIFGLQDESKRLLWAEVMRAPLIARINSLTGAKIKP